jgi:5-formyltetrahydrofolate cyclo-ligase
MDKAKIDRINTLARKQKTVGLSAAEVQEQAALRKEYLDEFRRNMEAMLQNVVIQRPDGTQEPLRKGPLN